MQGCTIENNRKSYAEMLIEKVEEFEKKHKRLPNSISEFGLKEKEDSPAYYQKTSDSTYIVWYGLSLGESNIYHSHTKKWDSSKNQETFKFNFRLCL